MSTTDKSSKSSKALCACFFHVIFIIKIFSFDPELDRPFKGDIDIDRLRDLLETQADDVPIVMLTITNNSGGGQPVSMANIKATKKLCEEFGKPLILDACRFLKMLILLN